MKVGIAYALLNRQAWYDVELPEGATVRDAIERSGVLKQFPEIDLATQKVGIFSKITPLDGAVSDGDRVEIYRPLTCDPAVVKAKAKASKKEA
ncbi:MAG: RnfH family protein [Thiothrix sp.]|jgi:putative ubiquitin-RnfH superfamily antitoxin RatB of RatAB toxin-antitoxin module|uniref:RnfH family protein n=1 Tax=Thiothrix sp. TaxID=1032 RepID=UPI0026329ADC|nr:RnfH family protein [Thiothrix sp.]MDD5394494.1 RnfH family protein [Thiothrix sp.]